MGNLRLVRSIPRAPFQGTPSTVRRETGSITALTCAYEFRAPSRRAAPGITSRFQLLNGQEVD
jgi:hypothetical protein